MPEWYTLVSSRVDKNTESLFFQLLNMLLSRDLNHQNLYDQTVEHFGQFRALLSRSYRWHPFEGHEALHLPILFEFRVFTASFRLHFTLQ